MDSIWENREYRYKYWTPLHQDRLPKLPYWEVSINYKENRTWLLKKN